MEASFVSNTASWYFDHPQFALVEAAASSSSIHERRWANTVKRELEIKQTIHDREQDDLIWYFLTFCCGYGFGYTSNADNFTWVKNKRLTPNLVAEQLGLTVNSRPFKNLSIAIPNQTMNVCLDIDTNSRYHPASESGEGIEPVKDALAEIGLVEALEFQSSFSTGLHLWYPLPMPAKSWHLANLIEDACRAKKLEVRDGVLELRPNKRNFDNSFKLIRAPFTGDGNALWIEGIGGLEDSDVAILRYYFDSVSKRNSLIPLINKTAINASSSSITRAQNTSKNNIFYYKNRLSVGFYGPSQTQEISLAALIVARMNEGIESIQLLRQRVIILVSTAPGFQQFCSHQREIESGSYWTDSTLIKQLQFPPADYEKSWRKVHNDKQAAEASKKALQAISSAIEDGMIYKSENAATAALRLNYGAPCQRWWKKPRNKKYKQLLGKLIQGKMPS